MNATVRIPWTIKTDNEGYWNEVCIWAIDHFGLPGQRFQTHANIDYMDFVFNSNKDALLMSLMWNGKIVLDEDVNFDQ
jgi:hypothetical protein